MDEVVWQRWAIYFVFGVPFLAWVFFTRNAAWRLAAVVAVQIFVQNSFADRRYLWAFGIGPSLITAYVALMGQLVSGRRLLPLGAGIWTAWAMFLFFALSGLMIGAINWGSLIFNVVSYQELYLEGLLMFVIGALAFRDDDEIAGFFVAFAMIGFVVACGHLLCLATGYRFRDFSPSLSGEESILYGGFFNNSNSQGSFYAMCIPTSLALLISGRLSRIYRLPVLSAIVTMIVSLLLSWHRAGFITTIAMVLMIVLSSRMSVVRAATSVAVGVIGILIAFIAVETLFPDLFTSILDTKGAKGLETERLEIFRAYLPIVAENPFGVGLYGRDVLSVAGLRDIAFVPHNIYLTMAVAIGIPGLLSFLSLVSIIFLRNLRAWMVVSDPRARQSVSYLFICVNAFLLVGVTEPVYENGEKLNHLFWIFGGMSMVASARILRGARERRSSSVAELGLLESPTART